MRECVCKFRGRRANGWASEQSSCGLAVVGCGRIPLALRKLPKHARRRLSSYFSRDGATILPSFDRVMQPSFIVSDATSARKCTMPDPKSWYVHCIIRQCDRTPHTERPFLSMRKEHGNAARWLAKIGQPLFEEFASNVWTGRPLWSVRGSPMRGLTGNPLLHPWGWPSLSVAHAALRLWEGASTVRPRIDAPRWRVVGITLSAPVLSPEGV